MTDHHEGGRSTDPLTEAEDRRRYLQGELDKVKPSVFTDKIKVKFAGEGASKWLNLTDAQYEAIKKIIVPEPASPVSYDPCITGTIEIGGQRSEFLLPLDNDSVRYSQWGADNLILWPRTDLLEGMADAAREWALDNLNTDNDEEENDD